jgi:hypothetical protein
LAREAPGGLERTTLLAATVLSCEPTGDLAVDLGGETTLACRAASCLLEPAPGDLVCLVLLEDRAYALAVLERPGQAPANLSANVPSSALAIAGGDLVLKGRRGLHLEAAEITTRSRRLSLFADAIGFVGRTLTQAVEQWRASATRVEVVAADINTQSARRVSVIDETDVLKAGAQVQTLATASVTSAPSVVVAAEGDLRLDGERVTVG